MNYNNISIKGEGGLTNQYTRIVMQRLIETGWACGVVFGIEVGFAGPQSRDFKRWADEVIPKKAHY